MFISILNFLLVAFVIVIAIVSCFFISDTSCSNCKHQNSCWSKVDEYSDKCCCDNYEKEERSV